jgi:hypothetical protein
LALWTFHNSFSLNEFTNKKLAMIAEWALSMYQSLENSLKRKGNPNS